MIERWAPPTATVSGDGVVLYMHGDLAPFLSLPSGEPRLEFAAMLRPHLLVRVRAALFKCRRQGQALSVDCPSPDASSTSHRVRVSISPVDQALLGEGAVVVGFESVQASNGADTFVQENVGDPLTVELERELQATRDDLRQTVEELESSNEELKASHEEALSMNEELQSSNEELEATTEELRSLNEELVTINSQLKEKMDQLRASNDDQVNFFASTNLATVFLDLDLRIQRFTPAAERLLKIGTIDINRRLAETPGELTDSSLDEEALVVLEQFQPVDREVMTADGRWFHRRVLPYRTEDERVAGVVVTFDDITERRAATNRYRGPGTPASRRGETGPSGPLHPDPDELMQEAVRLGRPDPRCRLLQGARIAARGRGALSAGRCWLGGRAGRQDGHLRESGIPGRLHPPLRRADHRAEPLPREAILGAPASSGSRRRQRPELPNPR